MLCPVAAIVAHHQHLRMPEASLLSRAALSYAELCCIWHASITGQVLANMTAMGSEKFAADRLPGGKVIGNFDMAKVNTRGGSLALGHPFGATGECGADCCVRGVWFIVQWFLLLHNHAMPCLTLSRSPSLDPLQVPAW